jgi:large subunit ribosomal protein L21
MSGQHRRNAAFFVIRNFEANMFAVIKTGGKQYRVAKDDIITVEKLLGEPGDQLALDTVLMLGEEGKASTVGAPVVDKAAVLAEVVEQSRADKIIVFKKQRRQNHRRKKGHRQDQTVLRILEVSATGVSPKAAAKKKAAPKKKAATTEAPAEAPEGEAKE